MGVSRLVQSGDAIEPNEFEFTYTGDYNFKDGAGGTIEIEFLTSGTFTLLKSSPFKPFDLCLVGGGGNGFTSDSGGGGGGGYVENMFDVPIELNKAYPIVIGGSAGDTTGFGCTAKAGKTPGGSYGSYGGDGGSGGGAYGGSGGFNGSDGSVVYKGGKGQHTSTRAFGTGRLLAGGGGGAGYAGVTGGPGGGGDGGSRNGVNGTANTGGGGGAGSIAGLGGSGIVILRRRWDADLNIFNTYNYITNNITTA